MKKISFSQIAPQIDFADETFSGLDPDLPKNYFRDEVGEGRMQADVISLDEVESYLLIHQRRTAGTVFYVCGCVSLLGGKEDSGALFRAVEKLAELNGCLKVVFSSVRRGLLEFSRKNGYDLMSVEMVKRVA